jgi:3-methyladenine DNA glycosylase Tag
MRKQMKAKMTALSLHVVEKKKEPFSEQFKAFKIQHCHIKGERNRNGLSGESHWLLHKYK